MKRHGDKRPKTPAIWGMDAKGLRKLFPALRQKVNGHPLVYLDNAATTQKPLSVIRELLRFYREDNANIHRGLHELAERATALYEAVREKARVFLGAGDPSEIVFTRGTTEALNLVAATFGRQRLAGGGTVLVSQLEHHSNIVPWQMAAQATGARLKVIPMDDSGELLLDEYERLLTPDVKVVALVHVSNALGTVNPVADMVKRAHARGIPVVVDGAQAVPHMAVDVKRLDCDFYAFSGHKVYGPMGAGVLYGKREHLEAMPPYQGGGDMIASVSFEGTVYKKPPHKFEAGTPAVADVAALGTALDFVRDAGLEGIAAREGELLEYGTRLLGKVPGLRIVGQAAKKAGVLSFTMEGAHPHDIGTILNTMGVAIRAGHHCAQPVMDRLGIPATARASLALYNTKEDLDKLVSGLFKVREVFPWAGT
jgi:cysteine desulfurase/selenocysteine lyase